MTLLYYVLKFALGEEVYRSLTQNSLFRNSYPFLVFGVTLILVMAGYKVFQHCISHANGLLHK